MNILDLLHRAGAEAYLDDKSHGIFRGSVKVHMYDGRDFPALMREIHIRYVRTDAIW